MFASIILAALRDHPGRALLSVGGICLGVALAVAVHTINASAIAEMSQATRILSGDADLRVEAGRSGFDESIYPDIVRSSDVAAASPVLELDILPPGASRTLRLVGIDALRAARVEPQLIGKGSGPADLEILRPERIFLNASAQHAFHVLPGGGISLATAHGEAVLTVAGNVDAADFGMPIAVMDIGALQTLLGREGTLTRIDIRLRAGITPAAARSRLAALLPPGVHVATPAEGADRVANMSRAYRVNLTVLALVALFTGAFLVFSTSALAVVRRRGELALLRVLGMTRREVAALLVAEGLLLGLLGSAAGCLLGIVCADLILARFGADLGSGFFNGVQPALDWDATSIALFFVTGTAAGAIGALVPALEAARRAPALALRSGDDETAFARFPSMRPGLVLSACGIALAFAPAIDGLPWAGFTAIGLLLIGAMLMIPQLVRLFLSRLATPQSATAFLAFEQVRGMPGFATAGMAAVVASFSLVVAMAIMVGSFRQSLDDWLGSVLAADLYVRAGQSFGSGATLPQDMQRALAAIPGVVHADFLRYQSLLVDPARPPVTLIARPLRPEVFDALAIARRTHTEPPGDIPAVVVSEAFADIYGIEPGARIDLPISGRKVSVFVIGVWRDYARSFGSVIIDRDAYVHISGDLAVNDAALWLDRGARADRAAVAERIRASIADAAHYEVADPDAVHRFSLAIFDRSFAVTYALELAALVVGLAGISSHFAALAFARRREFGVLRHLGMRRRDIAVLLASEGALIGALGGIVGVALGFAVSLILIYVVNRQSFHWSMEIHPPWAWLAALTGILISLASVSALASGRLAMQRTAVLAVKDDA